MAVGSFFPSSTFTYLNTKATVFYYLLIESSKFSGVSKIEKSFLEALEAFIYF